MAVGLLVFGAADGVAAAHGKNTRPCQDGQVTLETPAQVDGITGTEIVPVKIRNISKLSCTLRGYAQITVRSPTGARILVNVIHGEFGPKEPRRVSTQTLAPHQSGAVFDLSFIDHPSPEPASDCRRFAAVAARLPGQSDWLTTRIAIYPTDCEGNPPAVYLSPIGA
jgi:Protein of unknown function (DUF4232)